MKIPKKRIKKIQKIYKEKYGIDYTEAEVEEATRNLVQLVLLFVEIDQLDKRRQAKLKDYPQGFCFDDDKVYNCPICYEGMRNDEVWYDDCGQKCLDCQDNLNKKRIPKMVFKNHDSWYSDYDLEYDFGIEKREAIKLVKESKLVARYFVNRKGRKYLTVYLRKDNKWLLKNEKR